MYQLLRRSCLALTFAALLIVPAWHLGNIEVEGSGVAAGGPWARMADQAGLSATTPRALGVLWSVEVLGIELLDPLAGASLLDRYPDRVVVIGVVPESIALGIERTPAVQASIPELVERVVKELTAMGYPPVRAEARDETNWGADHVARTLGV